MRGWLPGVTSVPGEPLYLDRFYQEELSVWFLAIIAEGPDVTFNVEADVFAGIIGAFLLLRAARLPLYTHISKSRPLGLFRADCGYLHPVSS
jgi:hypothetical protein